MATPPRRTVATPPPARTMSVLAASKVLGMSRAAVERRIARGLIQAEQNEHGHLLPLRQSVVEYKAQMGAEATPTAA